MFVISSNFDSVKNIFWNSACFWV